MARIAIVFGILLISIGLAGYFGSGMVSWTALIPAIFGSLLLLSGCIALNEKLRMHAMHAAVLVGLIGLVGGIVRLVKPITTLIDGKELEHPIAFVMTVFMTILCGIFVAVCVKSFIAVRRARKQQAEMPTTPA